MGRIIFSVFQKTKRVDSDGLPPIVPLDTIAFEGFCIVQAQGDVHWHGKNSKNYESPLLFCPTWGELLKVAEAQAKATKDRSHVYLEDVVERGEKRNMGSFEASIVQLFLGS